MSLENKIRFCDLEKLNRIAFNAKNIAKGYGSSSGPKMLYFDDGNLLITNCVYRGNGRKLGSYFWVLNKNWSVIACKFFKYTTGSLFVCGNKLVFEQSGLLKIFDSNLKIIKRK